MVWRKSKLELAPALALILALGAGVGSAAAQTAERTAPDSAEVEQLLTEAVNLRRAGKDAEALQRVEQARVESASARVRAHLAAAHQALGHWSKAEQLLKELLEVPDDPYVKSQATALRKAYDVVVQHLGRIDVVGQPPNADVLLSGRHLGVLPFAEPARVDVGSYVLEVQMQGYHPVIRPVTIRAGGLLREAVQLMPVTEPAPSPPKSAPDAPRSATPVVAATRSHWMTWTFAGLGTAAAASGVIAWWSRERHVSRWNSSRCLAPDISRGQVCPGERDAALRAGWIAITSGVAASLLLGGAVLSVTLREPHRPSADRISVRCSAGWVSASCHGSF